MVSILAYIAFLIYKRYIPDPEQLNQQRFKCAAQMRETLYFVNVLIFNSKAVVERRGFRPKIFDDCHH